MILNLSQTSTLPAQTPPTSSLHTQDNPQVLTYRSGPGCSSSAWPHPSSLSTFCSRASGLLLFLEHTEMFPPHGLYSYSSLCLERFPTGMLTPSLHPSLLTCHFSRKSSVSTSKKYSPWLISFRTSAHLPPDSLGSHICLLACSPASLSLQTASSLRAGTWPV